MSLRNTIGSADFETTDFAFPQDAVAGLCADAEYFAHLLNAVELGVLREIVLEGNDGRAVEDQPLTGIGIGDVVLLAGRDVQRLRENLPVAGRLIQKVDKIRVFKDVLYLAGRKQILDVLGNAGRDAAPFSETLPDFHAVRGGLFFFQQKVELVHIVARCLVLGAVDENTKGRTQTHGCTG